MHIQEMDWLIEKALEEDMPEGDVTSESIVSPGAFSEADIISKETGILAGMDVAARVFWRINPSIQFHKYFEDGQKIAKGDVLAKVTGNSIALLKGERTALNFLQRMSGIATTTGEFVRLVKEHGTKILDTRKTTPCLRALEKYAVKTGGGQNHRMSLSDMVLIKDNHIKLAGSISEAIRRAKARVKEKIEIEVETKTLEEVKEALKGGADRIMLDNMSFEQIREAVKMAKRKVSLEVSGNVTLKNVRRIASAGVDCISVGALTHSFHALDISMDFRR